MPHTLLFCWLLAGFTACAASVAQTSRPNILNFQETHRVFHAPKRKIRQVIVMGIVRVAGHSRAATEADHGRSPPAAARTA